MIKILNTFFSFLKFILLILSFGCSFFIILSMYNRVGKSMTSSISIFLPYVILLVFYTINFSYHHKSVTKNIFYNITSCFVFLVISFVCFRTLFDKGMILNELMGYGINFSYFSDFIPFMQVLIYGLCLANLFLILGGRDEKKEIASKIEVL